MSRLTILCSGALLDDEAGAATDDGAAAFAVHGAQAVERVLALPTLAQRLSRAQRLSSEADRALVPRELPAHGWLRREFELPAHAGIEACSASLDVPDDPVGWRLTPVHLQVGFDHVTLTPPSGLAIDPSEATALVDAARPAFDEVGLRLLAPVSPSRWYCDGRPLDLQVHESASAAGRSIEVYEPSGSDARLWRRLITTVQMAWHEHPAIEARQRAGQLAPNSVWLEGRPGRPARRPFDLVLSASVSLRALAQASGAVADEWPRPAAGQGTDRGAQAMPTTAFDAIGGGPPSDVLVESRAWLDARMAGDLERWIGAWAEVTTLIDAALAGAAGAGRQNGFDEVRLVLCGERRSETLSLARRHRWALWRAADPRHLLQGAAR